MDAEIISLYCDMQKRVTFIRWEQSFVAGFVNCKHYIFDIDLTWSPRFDKEQPFITASKISKPKQASQPVCIAVIFAQCLIYVALAFWYTKVPFCWKKKFLPLVDFFLDLLQVMVQNVNDKPFIEKYFFLCTVTLFYMC